MFWMKSWLLTFICRIWRRKLSWHVHVDEQNNKLWLKYSWCFLRQKGPAFLSGKKITLLFCKTWKIPQEKNVHDDQHKVVLVMVRQVLNVAFWGTRAYPVSPDVSLGIHSAGLISLTVCCSKADYDANNSTSPSRSQKRQIRWWFLKKPLMKLTFVVLQECLLKQNKKLIYIQCKARQMTMFFMAIHFQ